MAITKPAESAAGSLADAASARNSEASPSIMNAYVSDMSLERNAVAFQP